MYKTNKKSRINSTVKISKSHPFYNEEYHHFSIFSTVKLKILVNFIRKNKLKLVSFYKSLTDLYLPHLAMYPYFFFKYDISSSNHVTISPRIAKTESSNEMGRPRQPPSQ